MPVLTDLASAAVKRGVKTLYGTVYSRPALLVTDGINLTYACDVEIGALDPTGRIDQYKRSLTGLPGQGSWNLDSSLTINTILHNVLIARGNRDLIYADIGNPVTLSRNASGQWEVTGFSIEQPGTWTLVPVHIGSNTLGPILDASVTSRRLTLEELGTWKPFGQIPLGASAIFVGGVLVRIV